MFQGLRNKPKSENSEIDTIETEKNDTVSFVLESFDPDGDGLEMELLSSFPSLPENLSFDEEVGEFNWMILNQETGSWDFEKSCPTIPLILLVLHCSSLVSDFHL